MVDGLVAISSAQLHSTSELWFTTLVTFYYTTSRSLNKSLEIIMDANMELSVQARNLESFIAGEVSWNKSTSINVLSTIHKREALKEKSQSFLHLDIPKILDEKLHPQMDTIKSFFKKIRAFLFRFSKEHGRPTPLTPASCATEC